MWGLNPPLWALHHAVTRASPDLRRRSTGPSRGAPSISQHRSRRPLFRAAGRRSLPRARLSAIGSCRRRGARSTSTMASSGPDPRWPPLPTPSPPTRFDRAHALDRLGDEPFDVLVVGGGITGAGVALDAAARGLKTALVERADFACGTSSKSSKLVHGGLRYLQQTRGAPRLREPGRAPAAPAQRPAPGRLRCPSSSPSSARTASSTRPCSRAYSSALWLYDLTGGLQDRSAAPAHRRRGGPGPRARPCAPTGWSPASSTTTPAPTTPASRSPSPAPRCSTTGPSPPTTSRSRPCSRTTGGSAAPAWTSTVTGPVEVRASAVVNATGVWADHVRALDEGADPRLHPAGQGRPHHRSGATSCRATSPPCCRCRATAARCSSCRGATRSTSARPTPTTRGRSTIPGASPRTSTTCSRRSTPG